MKRISILLIALLLGLAVPAVTTAQFGPTDVPAPLTQPDETAGSTPFEEDTGLSTLQLVLMFGGAIAVVGLIAWVIMRDAHRAAPVSERERPRAGEPAAAGPSGAARKSAREREREQARKRNKAKAARNQRKRNRSR